MPQSPNSNDIPLLPRATAIALARRTERDASAEHGRRRLGGDLLGDLEDEMRGPAPVVGVAAIGLAAVDNLSS